MQVPEDIALYIKIFDFCVCIVLLIEWFYVFYISKPKKLFLKQKSNWIDLIASIPFDALVPIFIPQVNVLRYLRLLKLLRVVALFNRFFDDIGRFIETSNLDKIIGGVIFIIAAFTLILYIYGPSHGLFDDFYFVIVTLSTVGYGDITPITNTEKIITVLLIFAGIFVFSTITAAVSSYLTDRLLNIEDKNLEETIEEMINEKTDILNNQLDDLKQDLEITHKENKELKQEIIELKDLLKK